MPWGARLGLLDGGSSHNGTLLGPSESLRGGTSGILILISNPRVLGK
jgi:hypothetical protein